MGPHYHINNNPAALLKSVYRNSFDLALKHGCKTVAVPAVSCGVYCYPLKEAARIALRSAANYPDIDISFCLFNQDIYDTWQAVLEELAD